MNLIESNEKYNEIPNEVYTQIVVGAIVFKSTFQKYMDFIENSRGKVEIIYQKKIFDKNKKLIISEVNGEC